MSYVNIFNHYRDQLSSRPAISDDRPIKECLLTIDYSDFAMPIHEANILKRLVKITHPFNSLEIGSYLGWSTAHIIDGFYTLDQRLLCVDLFLSEKAENYFKQVFDGCSQLSLVKQDSISFLECYFGKFDFILVDGYHHEGYPLAEVTLLQNNVQENAVICLHDMLGKEVREAGHYLADHGYGGYIFNTDNSLGFFTKSSNILDKVLSDRLLKDYL